MCGHCVLKRLLRNQSEWTLKSQHGAVNRVTAELVFRIGTWESEAHVVRAGPHTSALYVAFTSSFRHLNVRVSPVRFKMLLEARDDEETVVFTTTAGKHREREAGGRQLAVLPAWNVKTGLGGVQLRSRQTLCVLNNSCLSQLCCFLTWASCCPLTAVIYFWTLAGQSLVDSEQHWSPHRYIMCGHLLYLHTVTCHRLVWLM